MLDTIVIFANAASILQLKETRSFRLVKFGAVGFCAEHNKFVNVQLAYMSEMHFSIIIRVSTKLRGLRDLSLI